MNTYLGISSELGPEDVPEGVAARADLLFLEGYLYDKPRGKEAFETAARLTHAGRRQGRDRALGPLLRGPPPRRLPPPGPGPRLRHRQPARMGIALPDRPDLRARPGGAGLRHRRLHPLGRGRDPDPRRGTRHRPRPAASSPWTRPARATSSRRASSTASRRGRGWRPRAAWAAPPRPRSSRISARGPRPTSARSSAQQGLI